MEKYKITLWKGFRDCEKITEFGVEVTDEGEANWIGKATATMLELCNLEGDFSWSVEREVQ